MTYEYSATLHLGEDVIFYLPLEHPAVIKQNHVFKVEGHDLMAIGSAGYDELKDELDLPALMPIDSEDYVAKRMVAQDFDHADKLTSVGYGLMYRYYKDTGHNLLDIISIIPNDLPSWVEATVDELTQNFEINTEGMTENDEYMAVLAHIEGNDKLSLVSTYSCDGKDWILYNFTEELTPLLDI